MKYLIYFTVALIYVLNSFSYGEEFPRAEGVFPQTGLFGLGLIIGEPTGIGGKYWFSGDRAIDFAIGASVFTDFRIHGTYLWHIDAFDNQRLPLHYGIGASISGKSGRVVWVGHGSRVRREEFGSGIRGSLGVSYLIPTAPFDLFGEVGAIFVVFPPAGLDVDMLFGIRYYF